MFAEPSDTHAIAAACFVFGGLDELKRASQVEGITDGGECFAPDTIQLTMLPAIVESVRESIAPICGDHTTDMLRLCEGIGYIDAATVLEP